MSYNYKKMRFFLKICLLKVLSTKEIITSLIIVTKLYDIK